MIGCRSGGGLLAQSPPTPGFEDPTLSIFWALFNFSFFFFFAFLCSAYYFKVCNNIKYLKLIEVQLVMYYYQFLVLNKMSKNERKIVSRMWENACLSIKKPQSFQSPLVGPGPQPLMACFAYTTLLGCVSDFQSQKLGPPLSKILDPHLMMILSRSRVSQIRRESRD